MARNGSETRQRPKILAARFNALEAAAIRSMADAAGVPVSTLIRHRLLGSTSLPRASRRPTVSHEVAARLLAELGRIHETLRAGVERGDLTPSHPLVATAMRDLAEMRAMCLEALGRSP
ncbi:MAG: hypothetical protein AB7T86_04970 [Xanthobacteraceae bacterium]